MTRDEKQNQLLNRWLIKRIGVLCAYTGFGKTVMGVKIAQKFREKFDTPIVVVVPTLPLKEEWERRLGNVDNVVIYVINTYTMSEKAIKECGLMIVDEVHRCLNENSQFFSSLIKITKYEWFLGLSATLDNQQIKFLKTHGIEITGEIKIDEGVALGFVPEYRNYNIPVPMLLEEQREYVKQNSIYNSCHARFTMFNPASSFSVAMACSLGKDTISKVKIGNLIVSATSDEWAMRVGEHLGEDYKEIKRLAVMWKTAMSKRDALLMTENKLNTVKWLISKLNHQRKKVIVFCPTIEIANLLHDGKNSFTYHSQLTSKKRKEVLDNFKKSQFNTLVTCKSLDEGYDLADLEFGINYSFTSKNRQSVQRMGRLLRWDANNPDKIGTLINLYCQEFTWEGKTVQPHDKFKLIKAQENQNVIWSDIKQLRDELFKNTS